MLLDLLQLLIKLLHTGQKTLFLYEARLFLSHQLAEVLVIVFLLIELLLKVLDLTQLDAFFGLTRLLL